MNNQPTTTFRLPANGGARIDVLIVVREATMHSPERMLKMITQTLKQWDHLAGVTDVLALGIDPIKQGEATLPNGTQLQLRVFNATNNRAVLFEYEGVMYLYSMGPASAKETDFDDCSNAFVELLCDVIETCRPEHLNVATFSQLLLCTLQNDRLHAAMKTHVEVLNYGRESTRLDSHTGSLSWHFLVMIAARARRPSTPCL